MLMNPLTRKKLGLLVMVHFLILILYGKINISSCKAFYTLGTCMVSPANLLVIKLYVAVRLITNSSRKKDPSAQWDLSLPQQPNVQITKYLYFSAPFSELISYNQIKKR